MKSLPKYDCEVAERRCSCCAKTVRGMQMPCSVPRCICNELDSGENMLVLSGYRLSQNKMDGEQQISLGNSLRD